MPISFYSQYSECTSVVGFSAQAATADDYLAQAKALLGKKDGEREVVKLANQVLAMRQDVEAYLYSGRAKDYLGDKQGEIADYTHAIAINPQLAAD